MKKIICLGVVSVSALLVGLSLDSRLFQDTPSVSTSTDEESAVEVIYRDDEREIIKVIDQVEYRGGDIAFVDYSVDPQGECVVAWIEARSLFSHCDDVATGWQTLYHRSVPAGTDYGTISMEWSERFAPYNWS